MVDVQVDRVLCRYVAMITLLKNRLQHDFWEVSVCQKVIGALLQKNPPENSHAAMGSELHFLAPRSRFREFTNKLLQSK